MRSSPRIVLVETTDSGNIGATARAMKTMGLNTLVLVNPKATIDQKAMARASGASDILENALFFSNLKDAIAPCERVFGTSARVRELSSELVTPREAWDHFSLTEETAIVFGREHAGLTNEELQHCHFHIEIPTNPTFSSLNLAASVQVIAYEFMQARKQKNPSHKEESLPTQNDLESFYQHLESTLIAIDFLDPTKPKRLMPRLRRFFSRSLIEKSELAIFRGVLKKIKKE
jgi:tRNA (cytidine32/uridine32-2'-O)-methyltransferase